MVQNTVTCIAIIAAHCICVVGLIQCNTTIVCGVHGLSITSSLTGVSSLHRATLYILGLLTLFRAGRISPFSSCSHAPGCHPRTNCSASTALFEGEEPDDLDDDDDDENRDVGSSAGAFSTAGKSKSAIRRAGRRRAKEAARAQAEQASAPEPAPEAPAPAGSATARAAPGAEAHRPRRQRRQRRHQRPPAPRPAPVPAPAPPQQRPRPRPRWRRRAGVLAILDARARPKSKRARRRRALALRARRKRRSRSAQAEVQQRRHAPPPLARRLASSSRVHRAQEGCRACTAGAPRRHRLRPCAASSARPAPAIVAPVKLATPTCRRRPPPADARRHAARRAPSPPRPSSEGAARRRRRRRRGAGGGHRGCCTRGRASGALGRRRTTRPLAAGAASPGARPPTLDGARADALVGACWRALSRRAAGDQPGTTAVLSALRSAHARDRATRRGARAVGEYDAYQLCAQLRFLRVAAVIARTALRAAGGDVARAASDLLDAADGCVRGGPSLVKRAP